MYAMDMRQYDPAIARWVVQDPVVHYSFSPYNAFDNNPVYWADPSGADSQRDYLGRETHDRWGLYITPDQRGEGNFNGIDDQSSTDETDYYQSGASDGEGDGEGDEENKRAKRYKELNLTPEQIEKLEEYFADLKYEHEMGKIGLKVITYDNRWVALGHMLEFSMPTANLGSLFRIFTKGKSTTTSKTLVIAKNKSSSIFSYITPKINKQMVSRGWSKELIHGTVNKPYAIRVATNRANGNTATAYFTKEGGYVVRDNITGQIIQVSNRFDPKWVPDQTIINPFIPQ